MVPWSVSINDLSDRSPTDVLIITIARFLLVPGLRSPGWCRIGQWPSGHRRCVKPNVPRIVSRRSGRVEPADEAALIELANETVVDEARGIGTRRRRDIASHHVKGFGEPIGAGIR